VKRLGGAVAVALIWCTSLLATPQDRPPAEEKRPTADQAKNNSSDLELMQKIRKAVVDDKSLSMAAHNVKIIAKNGKVTLRGDVKSEEEKKAVEQKATEIAGAANVTNEMTVKAANKKTS
jgi:osmotically-inducible protein OsmY